MSEKGIRQTLWQKFRGVTYHLMQSRMLQWNNPLLHTVNLISGSIAVQPRPWWDDEIHPAFLFQIDCRYRIFPGILVSHMLSFIIIWHKHILYMLLQVRSIWIMRPCNYFHMVLLKHIFHLVHFLMMVYVKIFSQVMHGVYDIKDYRWSSIISLMIIP